MDNGHHKSNKFSHINIESNLFFNELKTNNMKLSMDIINSHAYLYFFYFFGCKSNKSLEYF